MPGTDDTATGPLALLRVNPPFRTLTVARVVSFVGDSLSLVALMLHVAATGQALAVAALLLVGDVVPALFSPLSGAVGDRFDRPCRGGERRRVLERAQEATADPAPATYCRNSSSYVSRIGPVESRVITAEITIITSARVAGTPSTG